MADKLSIHDWAEDDRPREKLERFGASTLSNAELLAILIGSGSASESAVDLMKRVLNGCNNNLNALGKLSVNDLTAYKGIGKAKAVTILAACEIGKRRASEQAMQRPELSSATEIYNYMHPRMQDLEVEEAWVLYLNNACRLIKAQRLSHGGITETAADIRMIIKEAVLCNATVMVFCHNHPSNNALPSNQDDELTQRIKAACNLMRICFLDHLIITDGKYYSYSEEGRM